MKRQEEKETIQVHQSVYSSPIYELEVWGRFLDNEYTAEDYKIELEYYGELSSRMFCMGVGLYPTHERALQAIHMLYDDPIEGQELTAMFIRQKPLCCLLQRVEYIKEWSYQHGYLVDESIVRNYDERYYTFYGRPEGMIHHKVGDIVQYYYGDGLYWGIIDAVPPTIEYVKELYDRIAAEEGESLHRVPMLGWSDDSYRILISNKLESHEHIPAHHVFEPFEPVPDFVRELLTESFRKANENR